MKAWLPTLIVAVLGAAPAAYAIPEGEALAAQGSALAKKYCYQCHGITFNGDSSLNVMDRDALLDPDHGYVIAGKHEDSMLWQRVADREMPPKGQAQPTDEEREIFRAWITAGAPMVQRVPREYVQWQGILQAMHDDLQAAAPEYRPWYRYFTLTHLYNNVEGVTELEMRLYRAALAKALNSVCWEPDIVIPHALDPEQTLFRVDLRDLGWTADTWRMILRNYPYGMTFGNVQNERMAKLSDDICLYTDTGLCHVRADWFIVRCMRSPIYNQLLELPNDAHSLEKQLQVDVIADFNQDRLARAGFVESAVSQGNRIVDRHPALHGYYWRSYDFKKSTPRGNIMQFPLGPDFDGHPYHAMTFDEDGGEMIFGLPNGLQAYFLVDGEGKRIDEGPTEVVRDLTETSGTVSIANGLSCMSCHRHGMIQFKDTLREGASSLGDARRKIRSLCPPPDVMAGLLRKDSQRFLRAIQECTGPFLQVGDDAQKPIEDFPEPIGSIARKYEQRLSIADVACECLVQDAGFLKGAIAANVQLRSELGLGPLVNGEKINRNNWETREKVLSPAQTLMQAMEYGTPYIELE